MSRWNLTLKDIFQPPIFTELDFIILGATGLVGRHVVLEAVKLFRNYRWGIAGRNQPKMAELLAEVGARKGADLSKIPIVLADVSRKRALLAMATRCRVLLNCCGPSHLMTESVIEACLAARTHYVDMNAEPTYIEALYVKYNVVAIQRQVYIVLACGLRSLPLDLGLTLVEKSFKGAVTQVEAYTEHWSTEKFLLTPVISRSAWNSFITTCSKIRDLSIIRKSISSGTLTSLRPKCFSCFLQDVEVSRGVCLPFPVLDQQVVEMSQAFLKIQGDKTPFRFCNYLSFSSYFLAFFFFLWFLAISVLAQITFVREKLLLRYPRLFSLGFVATAHDPDFAKLEKTFFRITFKAVGWSELQRAPAIEFEEPVKKRLLAKINGQNPVYGVGCVCLLTSAITILEESFKLPGSGGVFTPAAAFSKTSIVSVIDNSDHGWHFHVMAE